MSTSQERKPTGRYPSNTVGNPQFNRNQRRMTTMNTRKAEGNWADEMRVDEAVEDINAMSIRKSSNRNNAQRRLSRSKPPSRPDKVRYNYPNVEDMKGVVNSPVQDELMWDEGPYCGTTVVQQQYSQNFDFSTFPDLVTTSYHEMEVADNRMRRKIPECNFQHAMNEVLQCVLIDKLKTENADKEFQSEDSPQRLLPEGMEIPAMIGDYIQTISKSVTTSGDTVFVNVPEACRPLTAEDNEEHAGTFGPITADSHNKYECYVSPAVTKNLILRTVEANNVREANSFMDWDPLPQNFCPANTKATSNLLGYRIPERLHNEGLSKCERIRFETGDTIAGRICHSPHLIMEVTSELKALSSKIKTVPIPWKSKPNQSVFGIVQTNETVPNIQSLSHSSCEVYSPVALGSSASNKCGTYGLKRSRTAQAPGHCLVSVNDNIIANWEATNNANFNMTGVFSPKIGVDRVSLREKLHSTASPGGSRIIRLYDMQKRFSKR